LLAALTAFLFAAAPAEAHRLRVFAAVVGGDIEGRAWFVGGGRPIGARVRATTPDGRELATTTTDSAGTFRFPITDRIDHLVSVDTGDGHAATMRVAVSTAEVAPGADVGMPADPVLQPARDCAAAPDDLAARIETAVAREIAQVRADLDAHESRVRLSDVAGGLGTVFGIAGLWMMIAARRKLAGPS
jgi:nickel transport protein